MISGLLGKKGLLGGLLVGAVVVTVVLLTPKIPGASSCSDSCYSSKSVHYKRCRAIPPQDREARVSCFKVADNTLQRCLRSCPP